MLVPAPMDPAPADARLSNYRLERLLGQGGMGAVYLARDLTLDRPVAIKFINPERAADPVARQRLLREARAAAALDHPNICVIHEVIDEPGGRAGIVMQYVEGETLASRLPGGPLDVRLALTIASDIASALAVAHRHNVIHRDIKPHNIVLTKDHHAKLLDFGLAVQHLPSGSDDDSTQAALTLPGALAGTPAYMSPEQAQGLPLDGRSDLFSLGCVLYECLTGRRPFTGNSPFEVAHQVLSVQPPAPSSLRPELTAHHDELCLRLLAKHRDERFQSADELLGAIRVSSSSSSWSRPLAPDGGAPGPRLSRRVLAVAASIGLLALVGFVAWWNTEAPAEPSDPQAANWYRQGTGFIRDGAPQSARRALLRTIESEPDFVPAYVRLAEAETELDETEQARATFLRAGALISGRARLGREDRTRVDAVRALMLRDPDEALRAYREIAEQRPDSPEVWLDLGRAQQAFSLAGDAKSSFQRALKIDNQYAAAHLRLGTLLSQEGKRDEALEAFEEAERLYRASSNVEGQVEAHLRRATTLNAASRYAEARKSIELTMQLAAAQENRAQQIRAQLVLSGVMAAEGQLAGALETAERAVQDAAGEHLELVAADGLIELAMILIRQGKVREADVHLSRASDLAEERRAYRIVARAKLQRAYVLAYLRQPAEALEAARWPLEFVRTNRYRGMELIGLAIVSRAHEALGNYGKARAMAEALLREAKILGDDSYAAEALENLAGQANAQGDLPAAARYRAQGLEIHRRQNDATFIGYDLINLADLLIRLGRSGEAMPLLDEIDRGVASGLEAFVPRKRRADALRLMSAAIEHNAADIRRYAGPLRAVSGEPDAAAHLAAIGLRLADALEGKAAARAGTLPPLVGSLTSSTGRELRYWDLFSRLSTKDPSASAGAAQTLTDARTAPEEFMWRIAAIAASSAGEADRTDVADNYAGRAREMIQRLRSGWGESFVPYANRRDLHELHRRVGMGGVR
jgi:tetratricopeptide (TPR) repeat protein